MFCKALLFRGGDPQDERGSDDSGQGFVSGCGSEGKVWGWLDSLSSASRPMAAVQKISSAQRLPRL